MISQHPDNVQSFPAHVRADSLSREDKDAVFVLMRQLDEWCRSRGASASLNRWVANEALRQVHHQAWQQRPALLDSALPVELGDNLRQWPASWRYRAAELERRGMARQCAVELTRAEHAAASDAATSRCA